MLSQEFQAVYNIFKMNFYASMCAASKELTMVITSILSICYEPTILEYAKYMGIHTQCKYKINQILIKDLIPVSKRIVLSFKSHSEVFDLS